MAQTGEPMTRAEIEALYAERGPASRAALSGLPPLQRLVLALMLLHETIADARLPRMWEALAESAERMASYTAAAADEDARQCANLAERTEIPAAGKSWLR